MCEYSLIISANISICKFFIVQSWYFIISMLIFWLRVKEMLEYQDITQKMLAERIGESYNTVQSWINRNRLPNAEQAVKIANTLNTSVEYLVTGKQNLKKINHTKTIKLLEEAIENLNKNQ